jgi:collagen type III alpha
MANDVQTRYETAVDDSIAQVSRKIRFGDLSQGVLALACLVFGYALCVAVLDLSLGGSDSWGALTIRMAAFAAFLLAAGVLAVRIVARYLTAVNPLYAARQLEETIPESKNSLINWLELKNEPLPPVIRQAVGIKAARDLKQADPDVVSATRDVWRLAGLTALFVFGLIVLLAIVPRQFGSLMARAFLPIGPHSLATQTTIVILKPGSGDVTVPANQRIEFLARIEGRFPPANAIGAPALWFRQTMNDVPVRVPLEEDNLGQWGIRLGPDQIRTGIFWKITAGDASSPEAQLHVRAQPFVARLDATYTYRPYRKLAPETVSMPNEWIPHPRLLGHRGTEVVVKAHTNVPVKAGLLELDLHGVKKFVKAELPVNEPQTLVFRLGLEKSGTFRILFEAIDGEKNIDRTPYALDVMEDTAPHVELVMPGKDLIAPANGTVFLAGVAVDDFGITGLTLKLQLAAKPTPRPLAPIPYTPKFKLKFDDGTYPASLQYSEVMLLDQLRMADGKPLGLVAGDEITYWLEATDNFDFGRPNVGKSKAFKITIQDGLQPKKEQKTERQNAQAMKDQHDQDQKKDHDEKNQEKNSGGTGGKGDGNDPSQTKSPADSKNDQGNSGGKGSDKGDDKGDNKNESKTKDNAGGPQNNPDKKSPPDGGNKSTPDQQQEKSLANDLKDTLSKLDKSKDDDKKSPGKSDPQQANAPDKKPGSEQPKAGNKDNPDKSNPQDAKANEGKDDAQSKSGKNDPSNPGADKKDAGGKQAKEDKGGSESGGAAGNQDKDKSDPAKGAAKQGDGDGQKSKSTTPDKTAGGDAPKKGGDKDAGKDPSGGVAKSTDKKGTPDSVENGKTSDKAKSEVSAKKPDGPVEKGTGEKVDPKQTPGVKSENKQAGGSEKSPLEAKGKEGPNGEPKSGDPKTAKENPNDPKTKEGDGKGVPAKDPPTKAEIDGLKDLLKKKSPEGDAAAKDLAERGQDLQDPELKKSLEDLLREAGREDDLKKLAGNDRELLPPPAKEGSKDAPKDGQGNDASPITNPGGRGLFDELKAINSDEAFQRRLHNLQLENLDDLKKRIGPNELKEADISPTEWQRFLDNAKKYQDLMKRNQGRDDAKFLRGGASKIAPQGPRQVQSNPNAASPLDGAQATPPWEFRDAQEQFTRKIKAK